MRWLLDICGVSEVVCWLIRTRTHSFSAPPGHTSLLDVERVVECANQRLKIAIESLRLIFGCQSVRIDRQWTKRWNDIRRIAAGFAAKDQLGSINDENEAPNDGEMEVKSFCELMKDERRRRELYRFGFVDTMHRLLTKMTGLKWNLDALGDTPCTVDEVRACLRLWSQDAIELSFRCYRSSTMHQQRGRSAIQESRSCSSKCSAVLSSSWVSAMASNFWSRF